MNARCCPVRHSVLRVANMTLIYSLTHYGFGELKKRLLRDHSGVCWPCVVTAWYDQVGGDGVEGIVPPAFFIIIWREAFLALLAKTNAFPLRPCIRHVCRPLSISVVDHISLTTLLHVVD